MPLSFVILLAILKDLIAEIIRWREDRRFNSSVCHRLNPSNRQHEQSFVDVRMDEVKVRDILEIKDDELIPADCVLLMADNEKGQSFV